MTNEDTDDTVRHEAPTRRDSRERGQAGSRRGSERSERTRREYVKYGGAIIGSGLFAGCVGGGASESSPPTDSPTDSTTSDDPTATDSPAATDTETAEPTAEDTAYSVEMAPVGEVTFESPPETWVAYDGGYADMAVALGRADGLAGIGYAKRYYRSVYDELPGVDVPEEPLDTFPEVRTKEEFYELDCDVHLYDPGMLVNWFDWNQSDVEEIRENVAPFFANLIFRRSDEWHTYRYYTLYEAFEKVAAMFQTRDRYEAFAALHDEFIAGIQAELPSEEERPRVFLTYEGTDEPSTFSPYRLNDKGTSKKQWRDLGVKDALEGTDIENLSTTNRGELDYENLLEVDPDVILVRGQERKSAGEFRDVVLEYMQDHPVGSELTAVRNERVYRGGYLYQGPIQNLFQTERAAKQIYPDVFGQVTDDEELFDRQRVADIVNGDI
jgi:iron complex transport system substrate-binding protein